MKKIKKTQNLLSLIITNSVKINLKKTTNHSFDKKYKYNLNKLKKIQILPPLKTINSIKIN